MTLRELLYGILRTDAQSAVAGSLGTLLAHTTVSPYGVYFMNPPKEPVFPLLTYYFGAEVDWIPRVMTLNIVAWSADDLYDELLKRTYTLLHHKEVNLIAATDFDIKKIEWNWDSPDMYDEEFKVYLRQQRYLIYGMKV